MKQSDRKISQCILAFFHLFLYESFKKQFTLMLKRGYSMKYFIQCNAWNTHFMIVLLCKLPRNAHDILFEAFHEKNYENRFSEISLSWNTLLLNLFPCLISSFIIGKVRQSLKENVSIK